MIDERIEAYAEAHTTPPPELLRELAAETQATMRAAADAHRDDRGPTARAARPRDRGAAGPRDRHVHRLLRAVDGGRAARRRAHRHVRHRSHARRGGRALHRAERARRQDHRPRRARRSSRSRGSRASSTSSSSTPTRRTTTTTTRPSCPGSPPAGLIAIDNTLWSGRVLDPQDDDSKAIAALNDEARGGPPDRVRAADGARRRHARAEALSR